jgi:SOUL heme-binding protein
VAAASTTGNNEVANGATTEAKLVLSEANLDLNLALRSFPKNSSAGSAAQDLLTELKTLRDEQSVVNTTNLTLTMAEQFLSILLTSGPDQATTLPWWSRWGPLARFSRRARWASLRRTLNLIAPPAPQNDDTLSSNNDMSTAMTKPTTVAAGVEDEDEESWQRRRRRALLQVLRTLAAPGPEFSATSSIPAIRQIEQRARREVAAAAASPKRRRWSLDTLRQRRPVDLETPTYTVLTTMPEHTIEIRSYDDYAVCSVAMNQTRAADLRTDAALNEPAKGGVKAFGALAGYLFGKNVERTSMAMTSPVLTIPDQQRMSFVLPSVYWPKTGDSVQKSPPRPLPGSGVTIEQVPGETRAVLLFGGYAVQVEQRQQELLQQLERGIVGGWEVVPGATPVLAQYNDPFTPPWKRLNEVSVAVRQRQQSL